MIKENPFKTLTKFELILWLGSLAFITIGFLLCGKFDFLILFTSLLGATALIFVAKGNPMGQILTVVFAILYSVISFRFRYFGEMITYMGMTAPMAIAAAVQWFENPFEKGRAEVKIRTLTKKLTILMWLTTAIVTFIFYLILKALGTPNLFMSTISITTSFLASALTFFRNPFYALAYAANDIILIVLWILASLENPVYTPMILCFIIFLINDSYGFINWRKMEKKQAQKS